jgi:hypothetical protein
MMSQKKNLKCRTFKKKMSHTVVPTPKGGFLNEKAVNKYF